MSLLEVSGLTVRYDRGRRHAPVTALCDVDLTVDGGQTVSVVGESGSGKSTLGNAVLGLVAPTAGRITFAGQDITHVGVARRRALTAQIQAVFQDPYGSLNPVRRIGQTLEEPLLAHRTLSRAQVHERVAETLRLVGLDGDAAGRYPAQFSGGQLQRIAIARALMLSPRLLICDEVVSALDLSIQAQVLNLLRTLQRDLGLAYLFITHDLAVVRHVSHRVVVLYRGRLMETGAVAEVCQRPRHPYTQALLAAAPIPDPAEQRARRPVTASAGPANPPTGERGCPFRHRCPHATDVCATDPPVYAADTGIVACHRYPELHRPSPLTHNRDQRRIATR
jgi:oligopeptide/dipeptide ABC transporter ATP-binding protein